MTFESDLLARLELSCDRVFPDVADVGTPRPYVTYTQIGGRVLNPVANESPGKRNAVIQVNVWASTRLEAVSIINDIEDRMRTADAFQSRPIDAAYNDYDHDADVYASRQDFTIWFTVV